MIITGHDLVTRRDELPALDFNPDPSVTARARVALIKNQARLNGLGEIREKIMAYKSEEELGVRWFA